ncbi:MAG: porin family protein, partial [Gammaproteobacteria bacterium]|nr:porin family protein [Gammaproteobacteria bacterium]
MLRLPPFECRGFGLRRVSQVAGGVLALLSSHVPASAQDFVEPRTYIQFRSGEFATQWGVHDYWGLSVGRNFNGHWGVELAGDAWERYLDLGEESVNAIIPQVRYRYPLWRDRLVPYAIAGVGPVFLQFNDRKSSGNGREIDSEGWRLGASVGGGLEYFFNNNMAFVLEGKYVWVDSMDFTVDGRNDPIDMSNALVSIGIRAYLEQIPTQPMAEESAVVPSRYYFMIGYGYSVLTDTHFDGGLRLDAEPNNLG